MSEMSGAGVEWNESMSPTELLEQAEKAERMARSMEAEARRFRTIAEHLRRRAGV